MALVLESRFTKDQILELYLNDVTLGQRGPFEIHGVAEAARIFFGKDVSNLTLAEAATIAGLIQSPSRLRRSATPTARRSAATSCCRDGRRRTTSRRTTPTRPRREPLKVVARARSRTKRRTSSTTSASSSTTSTPGCCRRRGASTSTRRSTCTCSASRRKRVARRHRAGRQAAGRAQEARARRRRRSSPSIRAPARSSRSSAAAPTTSRSSTAPSPRGGSRARSSSRSSISRRSSAMADEGRADLTPATVVVDEPTTFKDGDNDYAPANYQNEYDGPITLRRALALSRNIVDDQGRRGDRLRPGRRRCGSASASARRAQRVSVDRARRLRGHAVRDGDGLHALHERRHGAAAHGDHDASSTTARRADRAGRAAAPVARADTTFLVTNMMRSVLNEGTGAGARAAGFTLDAAGKTGTTNDLRDAWFIGFTPELLTVVWVGFDNNQPIGLSGAQAALPIWTSVHEARARRPPERRTSRCPTASSFADIDKDTGKLATPGAARRTITEAFLHGHRAARTTATCTAAAPAQRWLATAWAQRLRAHRPLTARACPAASSATPRS